MKKGKKKELKRLMKDKSILQEQLREFLDDKTDQPNYKPFCTVLAFMENFYYESKYKGFDEVILESTPIIDSFDFCSSFTLGTGIGILYTVITLYLYNPAIPIAPVPDELMDHITDFKVKLENFIFYY